MCAVWGMGSTPTRWTYKPADRERFLQLADRWEAETALLSRSDMAIDHPAHKEIVGMGEPAVPLILERMKSQGGHWFPALRALTRVNPVKPADPRRHPSDAGIVAGVGRRQWIRLDGRQSSHKHFQT